jgi:hypothetical protein
MTRQPWTTDGQRVWLESRKPAYLEANEKKTAAKEFFPVVFKEFREKWPVPPVTLEEIAQADGSVERATKAKREKYDKVRVHYGGKMKWQLNEAIAAR